MNQHAVIGGNNPPPATDLAREAMGSLSKFLADNPVIETEEQARSGKMFVDRTRATIKDLNAERDGKVRPLNDEVDRINAAYKAVSGPLRRIYDELLTRLTDFAAKEEAKRIKIAEEARKAAELLEMEARLKEQAEREAKDNASKGELDVDLGTVTTEADEAFSDFMKSDRLAKRAERDSKVRIGGGFSGRAIGLRDKETLIVEDAFTAINEMGVTEAIREAVLTSARAYRKLNGSLPRGVRAETERSI